MSNWISYKQSDNTISYCDLSEVKEIESYKTRFSNENTNKYVIKFFYDHSGDDITKFEFNNEQEFKNVLDYLNYILGVKNLNNLKDIINL